jgi:HEAT repeat protein
MLERSLSADEQVALARVLARMSRLLKGDARANIGQYFEQGAAYRKELAALGSRRAWRRAAAAFALGDMAVDAAEPYLLGALEDPHRDVRAAAARSLGRIGSPQAVEPLVRRLANGTLPRIVAGSALLAIGDQALPRLRVLLELPDSDVRATAAELIGLLGSASDADALEPWLNDAHPAVRAQAATALGRVGARRGAEGLLAALEDEDPDVRVSAARALGAVRERAAVPALLRHARDDEFAPAHAAAAAAYATDPAAVAAVVDPGPQLLEVLDLAAL